jgi:hypothetical protein
MTVKTGMEYDVFISHAAQENAAAATEICQALEKQGMRCWIARVSWIWAHEWSSQATDGRIIKELSSR